MRTSSSAPHLGSAGRARVRLAAVLLLGAGAGELVVQRAIQRARLDQTVTESLEQEREELGRWHRVATPRPVSTELLMKARTLGSRAWVLDACAMRLRVDPGPEETVLRAGSLTLDLRTRRATSGERTVDLTSREFNRLETFLRHPDQVFSREQLLSNVWGYDFDPGSNVVEVYVRYLRRKLGRHAIETVRNMGYRVSTEVNADDPGGG